MRRAKQSRDLDRPVDQQGEEARPEAGRLQVERHRLRGDHRRRCPITPSRPRMPVRYRAWWTSTPTSARNQPVWARLDELTPAGRPGRRPAVGGRARRAGRASTSGCRPTCPTPAPSTATPPSPPRLTGRVARAGAVVYGTRSRTLRAVGRFFAVTFPAALWHVRHFVLVSAALLFVPALAFGVWIANSPAALEATGPDGRAGGLRRRTTSRTTTRRTRRPPSRPRCSPTTCRWRSWPSPAGSRFCLLDGPASSSSTGPTWAWPPGCSTPPGRRPSSGASSCPTACSS